MNFRIEEKEAFSVFGLEKPLGNELAPRDFWTQVYQSGRYQKLYFDAGVPGEPDVELPGMGVINAMGNFEVLGDYLIFAFVREESRTDGYKTVQIPESTWAIFHGRPAKHPGRQISGLFHRAYKRWLPKSGYVRAPGPDIEIYGCTDGGKYYEEAWIPVIKST
ncbi:MAG: effector binding domain-containing protein [Dehalococcoidia bacterium]|nr:effector binding domain-containing protein [Dehalococcoidia bacterium]